MRKTVKDVRRSFSHLCNILGKTEGYGIGEWHLSVEAGKYSIEEVCTEGGATNMPLGYRVFTATEFCEAVSFAIDILSAKGKEKPKPSTYWIEIRKTPDRMGNNKRLYILCDENGRSSTVQEEYPGKDTPGSQRISQRFQVTLWEFKQWDTVRKAQEEKTK